MVHPSAHLCVESTLEYHTVMEIRSCSAHETKIAARIALELLGRQPQRAGAAVIALVGPLGGGKTTFVQGLGVALGISEKVHSPTFVLMRLLRTSHDTYRTLYHIDCYRMDDPGELLRLGLQEILEDGGALVVVEWAEKIRSLLPGHTVWITFEHGAREHERTIEINNRN